MSDASIGNSTGQLDSPDVPPSRYRQVIEPKSGLRPVDLKELWEYRDLLWFLTWRGIKVRYAQSILGVGWAVVQPVFLMIVFTVVFGTLIQVSSDGAPYAIFSYAALVPWAFFSGALTEATDSLVRNQNMVSKIYFPRLALPLAPALGKLVDFCIAFSLVFILMAWFGVVPTLWIAAVPLLVLLTFMSAIGVGMWLTAMAAQYRDIRIGITIGIQVLMYASPVIYPASVIPEQYRLLYALNPMVGVIEGFRSALLGTNPMPWDMLAVGSATAALLAISGAYYFRSRERIFADVV